MLYIQNKKSPYVYEKFKDIVLYHFKIEEYTQFHDYIIKNKYEQDLEVELTLEYSKRNAFVFEVTTTNQKYTLDKSLKKQENLIRELSSITEKVELGIDIAGDIEELLNHNEIKEKWNALLPKLKRHHQGTLAHGYLDGIEKKITDKKRFTTDLKQYRMFGTLFNNLLRIPFDNESIKTRTRTITNVIHCLPVTIKERLVLVSEDVTTDILTYAVTGTLEPIDLETTNRIKKYFKYYDATEDEVYLENYSGHYKINKFTAWTQEAQISLMITNGRGYRRHMQFSLVK